MWSIITAPSFECRTRQFISRNPRKLCAVFNNLDTYVKLLQNSCSKPHLIRDIVRSEDDGIVSIDQRGGLSSFAETRLYVLPEDTTKTLHLITLGDRNSRLCDAATCREYAHGVADNLARNNRCNYSSVTEIIQRVIKSCSFNRQFERYMFERSVAKCLIVLRAKKGQSQADMASALKCNRRRIMQLENGKDGDWSIYEVGAYVQTLGLELQIGFRQANTNKPRTRPIALFANSRLRFADKNNSNSNSDICNATGETKLRKFKLGRPK